MKLGRCGQPLERVVHNHNPDWSPHRPGEVQLANDGMTRSIGFIAFPPAGEGKRRPPKDLRLRLGIRGRRSGRIPALPYPPRGRRTSSTAPAVRATASAAAFGMSSSNIRPIISSIRQKVGSMIPLRAREPQGVGRRSSTGEPQVLCTFQLDTRSFDRSVSGTPSASGARSILDRHSP